jgi:hypothetical protein
MARPLLGITIAPCSSAVNVLPPMTTVAFGIGASVMPSTIVACSGGGSARAVVALRVIASATHRDLAIRRAAAPDVPTADADATSPTIRGCASRPQSEPTSRP